MNFIQTEFEDVYIIEPKVFKDDRGFFTETYRKSEFEKHGIGMEFIQDNHAMSAEKNVIRGLHYQKPPFAQSKLVRVTRGAVYDVIVDLRQNSKTYKQWMGVELTELNFRTLFIPKGFAHGYLVLRPNTEFLYKVDSEYAPASEGGINWEDQTLAIDWFANHPFLSDKDKSLPPLQESLGIF